MNAHEALRLVVEKAQAFRQVSAGEPNIVRTYGIFADHGVARLNRQRLGALLEELEEIQTRQGKLRVLDIACGGGMISVGAALLGCKVAGIELNPEDLALAGKWIEMSGFPSLDLTLQRANVLEGTGWQGEVEKLLGGKPQVVILAYALHHLSPVEKFIQELSAWLPKGSVLLINEENSISPTFRLKHIVRTFLQRDTEDERHRSFMGWRRILTNFRFGVSTPRGLDLFPLVPWMGSWACWSLVFRAVKR